MVSSIHFDIQKWVIARYPFNRKYFVEFLKRPDEKQEYVLQWQKVDAVIYWQELNPSDRTTESNHEKEHNLSQVIEVWFKHK